KFYDKKLIALPSPEAIRASYGQATGERFPADFYFSGQNKNTNAQLVYYFQVKEEKAKESAKEGKEKKKKKESDVKDEKKEKEKEGAMALKKEDKPEEEKKDSTSTKPKAPE